MSEETPSVNAWQVEISPGENAIVAQQSLGHLLDQFELHTVPQAPAYANQVYFWKGKILPVIDLSALYGDKQQAPRLLGIVAYRRGGEIKQGAIALFSPPQIINVPIDAIDLPETREFDWKDLADSCVEFNEQVLPILNSDKVFSYLQS